MTAIPYDVTTLKVKKPKHTSEPLEVSWMAIESTTSTATSANQKSIALVGDQVPEATLRMMTPIIIIDRKSVV